MNYHGLSRFHVATVGFCSAVVTDTVFRSVTVLARGISVSLPVSVPVRFGAFWSLVSGRCPAFIVLNGNSKAWAAFFCRSAIYLSLRLFGVERGSTLAGDFYYYCLIIFSCLKNSSVRQ